MRTLADRRSGAEADRDPAGLVRIDETEARAPAGGQAGNPPRSTGNTTRHVTWYSVS